ncbi:hypothetical protein TNCV_4739661 [Trichonephila clavipes]|nr:hypothetical protein TNCV_4739661 [Trichonephila clavipes]
MIRAMRSSIVTTGISYTSDFRWFKKKSKEQRSGKREGQAAGTPLSIHLPSPPEKTQGFAYGRSVSRFVFDFSVASKAPSGEILLQSRKRCKSLGARSGLYGGWYRRSRPSIAIWFCTAISECGLALSPNNKTQDLRNPGHFFRIHLLDHGSTSTQCYIGVLLVHLLFPRFPIAFKRFFRMQKPKFFLEAFFEAYKAV